MVVAGLMPSPASTGLRELDVGNLSNALGSTFLSPSSLRSRLSVARVEGRRVPAALSVAAQQQRQDGKKGSLIVRNVVSTEKRDGFAAISDDDDDDYAENFRPPHITDNFDIPARPSTFCAKTR